MFDQRLKVLLTVFGVALVVILARLGQLQIVQAGYYRLRAERSILYQPVALPFVRGRILDRTGRILVREEPCWNLTIDYPVLADDVTGDVDVSKTQAERWKRLGWFLETQSDEELLRAFRAAREAMWDDINAFAREHERGPTGDLRERARAIFDRVSRIRRSVAARRGFDAPVAEETRPHAILTELDSNRQIAAREIFAHYPWVHVQPASVRRFAEKIESFAHVLGRTGPVDADVVAHDPNADDPFACYRGQEVHGITGVERLAEPFLRGRRGLLVQDREGKIATQEGVEPQNGQDVSLTLHADLQRRLYRLLGETVDQAPASSGGAIVVLDVRTREVLALVSYPSYDPNRFAELYPTLRDDTDRLPLWFRAVASRYAPGSTIKPLVCLAGLMNGVITLETKLTCAGHLLEEHPDRWRCWQIHGTNQRKAHGSIDVVAALTGSCNVFLYRLGEQIGVDRLCSAFDMMGIGRFSGIGLREENVGINPTPSWLMTAKNLRATAGTARLFAIGQGELSMTPLQVANLMATYASGRFRPATLIRSSQPTPEWTIPAEPEHWLAIRRGMFGVVNDVEGTAYQYAHFVHDRYALVGKTGSATAHPWPTAYRVPYTDASGERSMAVVPAGAQRPAIKRFQREHPDATFEVAQVKPFRYWPLDPPPVGQRHAHAWFAGFLQATGPDGRADWSEPPRIAFAVLIEFGGSGGRVSGPLGKAIAAEMLDVFGENLEVGGT